MAAPKQPVPADAKTTFAKLAGFSDHQNSELQEEVR
jgi:hypothetical protein